MYIKPTNLQNKGANGNLAMKGISRVFLHQKFQHLEPQKKTCENYASNKVNN